MNTLKLHIQRKRWLVMLPFLLIGLSGLSAQDAIYYYDGGFGIIDDASKAQYKREVDQKSASKVKVTTYQRVDTIWVKQEKYVAKRRGAQQWVIRKPGEGLLPDRIIRSYRNVDDDLYAFRDSLRGKTTVSRGRASQIMPLHKQDSVFTYYTNGSLKSAAQYDENRLQGSKNWLKNGRSYYDDIHYYVDQEPEHTMGQTVFRASIMSAFREAKIDLSQVQGFTEIGWVVLPDGSAEGFHSSGSKLGEINKVIITAIMNMPGKWIPARVYGKPVTYHMVLPFNFRDQSENFDQVELSGGFLSWD